MSCSTTMMVFVLVDLLQEFGGLMGFDVGHSRDRLVASRVQLGVLRQQHEISAICFWPCERLPPPVPRVLQANGFQHLLDCVRPRLAAARGTACPDAVINDECQRRLSSMVWLSNTRRLLEFPPEPSSAIGSRRARVRSVTQSNSTVPRPLGLDGDDCPSRGLAGAVRRTNDGPSSRRARAPARDC